MKIVSGVKIEEDSTVVAYFKEVDRKLRKGKAIFFRGAARRIAPGLYAIGMETTAGLLGFFVGPLMLLVSGMTVWVIWSSEKVSNIFLIAGLIGVFVGIALVSPPLHRMVMRISLRRLTGRWVKVQRATEEVMWRIAHGKI